MKACLLVLLLLSSPVFGEWQKVILHAPGATHGLVAGFAAGACVDRAEQVKANAVFLMVHTAMTCFAGKRYFYSAVGSFCAGGIVGLAAGKFIDDQN